MIDVSLTEEGTVLVRAPLGEAEALDDLLYLRTLGGRRLTWWTHLSDLRRDLRGRRVRWDPEVAPRLRVLLSRVEALREGNEHEVFMCFARGQRPYGFQLEAIFAGLSAERLLLADDTGLGKTIEALGILLVARARGDVRRAVVVCPNGLKVQWYEELCAFARDVPRAVVVQPNVPARRRAVYRSSWEVLIVNPELLRRDREEFEKFAASVDLVVLDEASCIRNSETDLFEAMRALWKRTRFRLALTATPVENCLHDLFSIFDWVDPRTFPSRAYFDRQYVVWRKYKARFNAPNGGRFTKVVEEPKGYKNLDQVRSKIRPCYVRRRVRDVGLELPELIVQWERVALPKRQRDVYRACVDSAETELVRLRGAALAAPLQGIRQACNSTELVERGGGRRPVSVKVVRIRDLLSTELAGEQVLVFTEYERFARILARDLREFSPARYTGVGTMKHRERQRALDAFKCGDRRVLIGTGALERGHNLQNAAVVINADLPFNPAKLKQRIGRVRRIKSEHEVTRVVNMVAVETVEDSVILQAIYKKRSIFEGVFGADELTELDPLASLTGAQARSML